MIRRFSVSVECESSYIGELVLDIDQRVFDAVDDEWRAQLYDLKTDAEIVQHIAYNVYVNEARLTQLDGWANLEDYMVHIVDWPYAEPEYEFAVKEI